MFRSRNSCAEVDFVNADVLVTTGLLYDSIEALVGPLPASDKEILETARNLWLKETLHCPNYRPG
jgi:hypothetical protein